MKESNIIEEFRVGNYIECDYPLHLGKITQIKRAIGETKLGVKAYNVFDDIFEVPFDVSEIRPIALTESLIDSALFFQKMECDNRDDQVIFEIPGTNWSLEEDKDKKNKWWLTTRDGSTIITEVKSLHHLQNIYLDLEGQ